MMSFCSVYHDLCYGKKDGHEGQWNDEVVNNLIIYRNTNLSPKPITGQSRGVVDYYARQGSRAGLYKGIRSRSQTVEVEEGNSTHGRSVEENNTARGYRSEESVIQSKETIEIVDGCTRRVRCQRHKFGDFASASQRVSTQLVEWSTDWSRETVTIGDGNV